MNACAICKGSCKVCMLISVFVCLVKACAKGKRWKTALELLEEMEANGIMPNAITYR